MRIDTLAPPLRREELGSAASEPFPAAGPETSRPSSGASAESPARAAPPLRIGHNGGPPLDVSFVHYCWKRAHREAWKNPPREVVLRRLERARALGMTYREYTAIILDRGVHL